MTDRAPRPNTWTFRKRLAILAGIAAALLTLLATGWLVARGQVEAKLTQRAGRMLAGSPFRVTWSGLALSPMGTLTIRDLRLQEGDTKLASVQQVQAHVAWMDLLRGRARATRLEIAAPDLNLALVDGKPAAWLRLREVVRKNRVPTEEPTVRAGLRRWFDTVAVHDGALHVQIVGKWALVGAGLDVDGLQGELDVDTPSQTFTAHARGSFGAAEVKTVVDLDVATALPSAVDVALTPPLKVTPNALSDRLLHGLTIAAGGLRLTTSEWTVRDVAVTGEAQAQAARIVLKPGEKGLTLQDVRLDVPGKLLAGKLPPDLAAQVAAMQGHVTVGEVAVALPEGQPARLHVRDVAATLGDLKAAVQTLQVDAPTGELGHPLHWRNLVLEGPTLRVPRHSPLWHNAPELTARMDGLIAWRKPVPVEPEPEPEDEEVPELAPIPPVATAKPAAGSGATPERPAAKWTRAIQAFYAKILRTHAKLEVAWRLDAVPPNLQVEVRAGRLEVTGPKGEALLGLADAGLVLGPARAGQRPLQVHGQPFDGAGSWGRLGLVWRRDPQSKAHTLELRLSGGGMAQLVAARVPGLHVGASADLDLQATARLPDAGHVTVEGRVEVDRMGIDWWRLSAQPIEDFRASARFSVEVGKSLGSMAIRVADATVGGNAAQGDRGALLEGTIDVTRIETHPKVDIQIAAPMQDCASMLRAIPPSLTPTIGKVEAHGVMDWHVGLHVPLRSVGAVQVDLALGDTLCTFDGFPNLDLAELNGDFDRPVNENGKILDDVHIGPASGAWTPLDRIPQYVSYAMWSTEDSFYKHRGISEALLAKALAIDLSSGRFVYGGSTITQQLVKNLYLKRTKALSRKFEEMLIVWQMEKILGKRRILEIYLNGVEFGPKVYGITRAAHAFFQKTPDQLLPEEGVYLAIIKPSPRSGYGTMRGDGWGQWYAEKCGKYMDKLLAEGNISAAAYQAAAAREFKPMFNPPAKGSAPRAKTPVPGRKAGQPAK